MQEACNLLYILAVWAAVILILAIAIKHGRENPESQDDWENRQW